MKKVYIASSDCRLTNLNVSLTSGESKELDSTNEEVKALVGVGILFEAPVKAPIKNTEV